MLKIAWIRKVYCSGVFVVPPEEVLVRYTGKLQNCGFYSVSQRQPTTKFSPLAN
jgi:hypothetical protein